MTGTLQFICDCSRNRAVDPPPSSSLAEEERLCSLLLRAAARDLPTLAIGLARPTLAAMDFWRGWPYPVAVAALFVVVMVRAGATYAIGRAAQEGVRRSRLARVMAKPRFARMQQVVARWGAPVVALSFLTVGIQTLVNLAAGVMRMPLRRYLPALTVGAILWAFLYATVGFATFAAWRRVYELSPAAAIASLVVLLAGLAGYIIWQVRHRHDEDEREPANLGA
jgi:membrane protein DedA with SNARE-associated domain